MANPRQQGLKQVARHGGRVLVGAMNIAPLHLVASTGKLIELIFIDVPI